MDLLCISASNIQPFKKQSASTRICEMAGDIARNAGARAQTLALIDYELEPCRMCGKCQPAGRCRHDRDFNTVYERMQTADGVLLVAPHYAPFPSKVMILFEKIQELAFLGYCRDHAYRSPLQGKPLGVIGHGGQTGDPVGYYQAALVEPLARAMAGVGMQVAPAGEGFPWGTAFGIRSIEYPAGEIFCRIEYDWEVVRERITPLVSNLVRAMGGGRAA